MIDNLIVWGGLRDLNSLRHIFRSYQFTAGKLGLRSTWVDDSPDSRQYLTPGSTVIAADVWSDHLPFVEGVRYVLHNFDGSHPICKQVKQENLLRLQVWTNDASGEKWDTCRSYDRDARTLFQPWGTDLLAEEFLPPVFNQLSPDATFVGAIWGEKSPYGELGNEEAIEGVKQAVTAKGLTFRHYTHVPDTENIRLVRAARLAPAVAGGWQVQHGYLPCRCFKNASYGTLMFTNVPAVNALFGEATVAGETTPELIENVLRLRKKAYEDLVVEQQRVASRYTYRESLQAIVRAFDGS